MSIRRDAAIGVAQAERDAGVREAECVMISEQVLILMAVTMIVMIMVAIENNDDAVQLFWSHKVYFQAKNCAQSKIEFHQKLLAVEQADCDR